MSILNFSNASKSALKRLSKVSMSIDKFCKKHPKNLTTGQHKTLRKLLSKRAEALSKCAGVRIHSLFDWNEDLIMRKKIRSDCRVGTLERMLGIPNAIFKPNGKNARSDMHMGTLRKLFAKSK